MTSSDQVTRDASDRAAEIRDLVRWAALSAIGLLVALLANRDLAAATGRSAVGRYGHGEFVVGPASVLAPLVAVVVVVAVVRGLHERLGWWWLQLSAFLAATAWAVGLAFVGGVDAERMTAAASAERQAPGAALLLSWLGDLGGYSPVVLRLTLCAISALVVPFAAAAVQSLCGEVQARRLVPILVLSPYAAWSAAGIDGVVAALCAGMIALGVMASERGRGWRWRIPLGVVSGLLLGTAALASYGALALALSLLCTFFVRRRPLLILVTAVAMFVPLAVAYAAGFSWTAGLLAARTPLHAPDTGRLVVLLAVDLTALLITCGPAFVASMRKIRNTPGWPLLVGAFAGLLFWAVTGLPSAHAVEAWLPYLPWLTVAAVAPPRQAGPPVGSPVLLIIAGAVTAVVVRALISPIP